MRLKSLQIQNFRSIDTFSINLRDFTSLIGPNNSGKSSLLRAIEIFLNQETPELEEWRKNHEKEPIIIEGVFDEIQEWERDTPGISGLVHNNEIRLRCKSNQIETPNGDIKASTPQYEAFTQEITITGWSDKLSEASQDIQDIASSLNFNGTNWRNSANKERARQVIRETRPDLMTIGAERWSSDSISINAALKQALPQAVLIEAVRDASEDAKPAAKTPFGLLMNKLVFPAIQKSDEYKQFIGAVQALDAKIRGNGVEKFETVKKLEQDIHDRMSSIIESKAIVTLDTPDTEKFIGGSAKIKIDDGIETPIHLQGHGVQRSLIFALIEVLAKQDSMVKSNSDAQATPEGATPTDSKQRATILLFEEPELYIHPHLMRRLQQSLQDISKSQNWQVIISTHSPFLVDVATDPLSLVILRREKSSLSPVAIQLESDPFNDEASKHDREALRAALDFHPTVTEAFFAQKVVLVEGDTEVAVLRHEKHLLPLAKIDKGKIDTTTIVSCGGKWTIPGMARLLSKFKIPFRVIHDLDRKDLTDEEIKILPDTKPLHPYNVNARIAQFVTAENIYAVDDTFEHLLGKSETTSDKPYKAWKAVRDLCKDVTDLDHAPKLKEVVEFAFNW